MKTRRTFLTHCSTLCACFIPIGTSKAGELVDDNVGFICRTVEPVSSSAELQMIPRPLQSDDLRIDAQPSKSDSLILSPYGTAFLKDTWLQTDVPVRNNKLVLSVFFLNGSQNQKDVIQNAASAWTATAVGNRFEFRFDGPLDESHIRIDFDIKDGNWSYVGRDNLRHGKTSKTMNISNLTPTAVQHELGHALGLRHEHQFPGSAIRWNKALVIDDMKKRGWTAQMTEEQILVKYNAKATCVGDPTFNPHSVMIYPIAPGWAEIEDQNGAWVPFVTSGDNTISNGDVACLRGLYRI